MTPDLLRLTFISHHPPRQPSPIPSEDSQRENLKENPKENQNQEKTKRKKRLSSQVGGQVGSLLTSLLVNPLVSLFQAVNRQGSPPDNQRLSPPVNQRVSCLANLLDCLRGCQPVNLRVDLLDSQLHFQAVNRQGSPPDNQRLSPPVNQRVSRLVSPLVDLLWLLLDSRRVSLLVNRQEVPVASLLPNLLALHQVCNVF